MKNNFKVLERIYKDTAIHFQIEIEGDVMVNATEMAKTFGKQTKYFLKTEDTKEFIEALDLHFNAETKSERTLNGDRSDAKTEKLELNGTQTATVQKIKIVENRGHMGIYFHRILALEFASWLDKSFKIWLYTTIERIMFNEFSLKIRNLVIDIKTTKDRMELLSYKILNDQFEKEDAIENENLKIKLKKLISEKNKLSNLQTQAIQLAFNYDN